MALHPRRLIAGALVLLVVVHVGMSLGTSVRNRYGPAGNLGFPPRPLALSSETKRLGYMRDPFVFIRAIEAGTSEDSFIAVPKIYEGGFVEHYFIPVIYPPGLTRNTQFMLGGVAIVVNVAVYIFVLRRWRRRAG